MFWKKWFKKDTALSSGAFQKAFCAPFYMTDSCYPDFEHRRWDKSMRRRKADGKVGYLKKVPTWQGLNFGQKRWEFKKFGDKPITTFRDAASFSKALKKRGFERLGSGAYSTVFAKPGSDRVIKVTHSADNWIDYVQWAAHRGYAGKYAPQVYSYKQIKGSKQTFSVSVMERMDEVFHKLDDDHDYKMLSGMMTFVGAGNAKAKIMLDTLAPGVSQFVIDLYAEFGNDRFDLHDGNFMVRKDGSFALTDPVCGHSKLTTTRLRAGDFTPALVNLLREVLRVIIDIEANGLKPSKIWLIVCKDIDTGEYHVFRRPSDVPEEADAFQRFVSGVDTFIGHNFLGYDYPVCNRLLGTEVVDIASKSIDTLIISKLVDYPRDKHSVESYGKEFGLEKGEFSDWSKYSPEMEIYCKRDVDITEKIFLKYKKYIDKPVHKQAIVLEHEFQLICNSLEENGFAFNAKKANTLLIKVEAELALLDKAILDSFPPRLKLVREVTPKETKYGTISLTSIPAVLRGCVSDLSVGAPFSFCKWTEFNPSSHKQIIEVLNEAGWSPVVKTQTHIETEREYNKLKNQRLRNTSLDLTIKDLYSKLQSLQKTGWKVNEENLDTLPAKAPASIKTIANRIVLESRRRTLTEWLNLVDTDGRIHGKFYAIGAWTHRMAHQAPNTANIPNDLDTAGKKKLYGKELRSFWMAPKGRLLVGCDAEGIQLRIFAHYINDPEFTHALVSGKKEDKSDPHSLNQRILGSPCKSRAAAKRFIFALLLGAGIGKLAEILGCDQSTAQQALDRLIGRYEGFAKLKETIIPADARRGWFTGLDGRSVRILGDTEGARKHLAMSGYLQNGEAVVIKTAACIFNPKLADYDSYVVDIVHDEYQIETPNDMKIALEVAELVNAAIAEAGVILKTNCPLSGSYWDDDRKDYTIDTNWSKTH